AVERCTDIPAGANLAEHHVDHLAIGLRARLALAVVRLQAAHVAVHSHHPLLDDRIGHGDEHDVGLLDAAARQRRQVRAERDADADAGEAAGALRSDALLLLHAMSPPIEKTAASTSPGCARKDGSAEHRARSVPPLDMVADASASRQPTLAMPYAD